MSTPVTVVFGAAGLRLANLDVGTQYLSIAEKHGVKHLDTARAYGESEEVLAKLGAPKKFIIDTKVPHLDLSEKAVLAAQKTSFENLQVESVDIYYLHGPDRNTPIPQTLLAINALHRAGKFTRFGLSNFTAAQVQEVYDHATEKGYVLPTVYQGNYNPVTRHIETDLLPLLRKLNIAYYAYSPIAGGFLSKSVEQLKAGGLTGRWDPTTFGGSLYHRLYNRPEILKGLEAWNAISSDSGIPRAELAYRWTRYHSALSADKGDALIVGASKPEQLEETLGGLENGPLPGEVVRRIEGVWEVVKGEAPRTEDIIAAVRGD
ncbi:hypothetical protein HDV00_010178 [Rhizophlyctis rosea]|nr:hypothetical protein HDV00_010178 [Rhizophlyctis rosea]